MTVDVQRADTHIVQTSQIAVVPRWHGLIARKSEWQIGLLPDCESRAPRTTV